MLIEVTLGPYVVSLNSGAQEFPIDQIKDSVSVAFSAEFGDGSGYDLCGPRDYQVFEDMVKRPDFARIN